MLKRTTVFIDGPNFHSSIRDFDLQEKDIDFKKLMSLILGANRELVRCYWYQAKELSHFDFFRWSKGSYAKYKHMKENKVDSQHPEYIAFVAEGKKYYEQERAKMEARRAVYENITRDFPFLEVKFVGELQLDPFEKRRTGIKGDDVALAVDMVSKCQLCDAIVLISGDYDYGPAVQHVKDQLKHLSLVTFERGKRPKTPSFKGSHRRLRLMCDEVNTIYQDEIPLVHVDHKDWRKVS